MPLTWIHESNARWDDAKSTVLGSAAPGSLRVEGWGLGDLLPGDWWRVERDGAVVGYGWMDTTWGDAEILLAVAADARQAGIGGYILDRLEAEAQARGLRVMHNVVPSTHPDPDGLARWLKKHSFVSTGSDGRLLRRPIPN